MASDSRFESLLKTWHGHTQKGDIEDYERQDQMRSLLRELAPDPTYAIVRARKRRFGSPAGLDIVAATKSSCSTKDSLYRFAGMEGVTEGHDKLVFSAAVTRVPFDQFHRVQVSDVRVPEHGATKCRRRWTSSVDLAPQD